MAELQTPILVAPRPVRFQTSVRLLTAPDVQERNSLGLVVDQETRSPTASPRASLPSEALEEFLSILRPSFFPPRSPVRSRRQASLSALPTIHQGHERSFSYKGPRSRSRLDLVRPESQSINGNTTEELELVRSTQSSRSTVSRASDSDAVDGVSSEFQFLDLDDAPFARWFASNVLASPISRNHTRNPFQRHATYPLSPAPGALPPLSPLNISPAAVPLPLPTPDELDVA
ncbi:hypothetical protein VKT23_017119 [Stygiomarasmius scandens]|uniref:Autophagy-related protein 13 n=1 Tax=Marasmiellus scandens TaxID=2682957 RepID=A0ABR1ISN1_9AGAR